MMAVIDLLSKFHEGKDDGSNQSRMVSYMATFLLTNHPHARQHAEVLYLSCRNPVVHYANKLPSLRNRVGLCDGRLPTIGAITARGAARTEGQSPTSEQGDLARASALG